MNREAAALGVPVYSFFRGKLGAVDRYLEATGKLTLLKSVEDVSTRLKLVRRDRSRNTGPDAAAALNTIVSHICNLLNKQP